MLTKIVKNKYFRLSILLATIAAFVVYYIYNQQQFQRLDSLGLVDVLLIILGQTIVITSNVLILMILVLFIDKKVPFLEASRITAYSSVVNFFGFLQGGLGVRAIYLKTTVGMKLKKYTLLTIVQYLTIFGISAAMVVIGVFKDGYLLLAGLLTVSLLLVLIYKFKSYLSVKITNTVHSLVKLVRVRSLALLIFAVLFQLAGSTLAAAVELSAIGADITVQGLLVYSGMSQFAIVFAITPAAIGVREALLLAVQGQMGISSSDIILAATIDRLVYFLTLGLFAPLALTARKLKLSKSQKIT
jgi:uncharacterized membrane protein YbhN (UPF0104 family)